MADMIIPTALPRVRNSGGWRVRKSEGERWREKERFEVKYTTRIHLVWEMYKFRRIRACTSAREHGASGDDNFEMIELLSAVPLLRGNLPLDSLSRFFSLARM